MMPTFHRRAFARLALLAALLVPVTGCVLPFGDDVDHWRDYGDAIGRNYRSAHRKFDRHFMDLDWDDPTIDWHDDSYATMPGWRPR